MQQSCGLLLVSGWVPRLCWKLWQIEYHLRREGTGTLLPLMFHKNGYQSCCYLTEKLVCIISSICVACIDHMKRMRFRDSVHGKCADVTFFGNNRVVQETDADPACNQCLDRNKAADRNLSVKITQFITGCDQPFFKNAACTGALFTDNNGRLQ